jgi:hypothetical protein
VDTKNLRRNSMRVIRIRIHGRYTAPFNNPFTANCLVMPVELSDSMRDEVLRKHADLFYVFTSGDPIVGEHHTFEVYSFDVISEEEVALA